MAKSKEFKPKPANEMKAPKGLMKVANVFMKRILRSRRSGKLGGVLMLLTFTGRKSGKQFTTPVGYRREGDTITIITDSPWWKNMEGGAPVSMIVKGRKLQGWAEPITDKEEVLRYTQDFLREHGMEKAREIGLMLPKGYALTEDDLRIILRDRVIIRIKPQGADRDVASAA
jgi:hypothetical protein